jgi:hypothetical protein
MASLRRPERLVVRFWDAATLTQFLFTVAVSSVIHNRDRQETGQFSYRRVPRWLIRLLGGADTKAQQGGNLARDTVLGQSVFPALNNLLGDLLA